MSEFRSYRLDAPECRDSAGGGVTLEGYAAVYGRYSQNLGGFVEVLEPGAFDDVLGRGSNIAGLLNHEPSRLLATTRSGTLRLTSDAVGLRYAIDLDETDPDGQSAAAKARRGTLRGSSFSFDVAPDGVEWAQTEQGFPLRRLRSIAALYDVGPVTFPAYLATEDDELAVSLRSLSVSTGHDVADLIAAARRNALADMFTPAQAAGVPAAKVDAQHARPTSARRWAARARNH